MTPGPPTYWTEERIVAALVLWNETHGEPPRHSQWLHATASTPSVTSVRQRFGSWNHAIRTAGLPTRNSRLYWTPQRIVASARAWAAEHGCAPVPSNWRFVTDTTPSYATVYYQFGSWDAMLTLAELAPAKHKLWTKDGIAAAMLDWLMLHGVWPTAADWSVAATSPRPSAGTVKALFGSWTRAKTYAGWDRNAALRSVGCAGCGCDARKTTSGCQVCADRLALRTERMVATRHAKRVAAPRLVESSRSDSEAGVGAHGAATPIQERAAA